MIIEYTKVRPNVIPPQRANPSDAGLDVFYCPAEQKVPPAVSISPGESQLFQTGLRFGIPHGYMLEGKNRSSIAAKKSLLVGACVIDSGYDGEVFINLHNVGISTQWVYPGAKIAQLVMVPVVAFRAVENPDGALYERTSITISDRGDGALGSTDAEKAGAG